MNKTLIKIKRFIPPLLILIIVITGVVYLLTQQNQTDTVNNTTGDLNYPQTSEAAGIRVIPVDNLKQIKLANSTISFNENYLVNTIMETKSFSGITCSDTNTDGSTCIIGFITDSKDTYYLSTPFEPIADAQINTSSVDSKDIESSLGTITLKYSNLNVVDEKGEIVMAQTLVVQIHGCAQNGICVGSGVLPFASSEDNKSAVSKFEDFVRSLALK